MEYPKIIYLSIKSLKGTMSSDAFVSSCILEIGLKSMK